MTPLSVVPLRHRWAQIDGSRRVGTEEKGALDEWRIQNASIWLDIRIMLRTIGIVLFAGGSSSGAIEIARSGRLEKGLKHADKTLRSSQAWGGLATRRVVVSARLLLTPSCWTDGKGVH